MDILKYSAAEFRKYCKCLHGDLYTKRKRLHAKYSIVHVVYLPFDNVWCLTAMGKKNQWAIIGLFSEYFHFLSKQVILRLIKLIIRNTLVLFYYMSMSLGYQLCLNLTPSQKNLWSPFNMSPGNDFPRIKNSVRAVEMLTNNNHLITLPALTVNYCHLHCATGAVNLFSVSENYISAIYIFNLMWIQYVKCGIKHRRPRLESI